MMRQKPTFEENRRKIEAVNLLTDHKMSSRSQHDLDLQKEQLSQVVLKATLFIHSSSKVVSLQKVRTNQSRDLKKPNSLFPSKNLLQLFITDNNLLVFWVLKIVLFDVSPDLFKGLGARDLRDTQ